MSGAGAVLRVPIVAVTDPRNARILLFVAYSLFAVGLAMICGTVYWWRRSRSDHPALARLARIEAPRRPAVAPPAGGLASDSTSADPLPEAEPVQVSAIDPLLRPEEPESDEAVTSG